jgi:hypothetical protein
VHDLATIIVAITGLLGAAISAYQAFAKHKKDTISELKADCEMYRQRWLAAEKRNEYLRKKLDDYETKYQNH